jgi:hypothetical protein
MTVAIIHYCLGKRQQHRPRTSSLINHMGEVSCMMPACRCQQTAACSAWRRAAAGSRVHLHRQLHDMFM